jgi:PAS domain S-box-containing protein
MAEQKTGEGAPTPEDLPFRDVARTLPVPCWISDASGQVVWVNDAWVDYTGLGLDQIARDGLESIHDPAVLPEVRRRLAQARAEGAAAAMAVPLRGRDGRFRPFNVHVSPLKSPDGEITRWFGVNTDISAQIDMENRLRSSEEQLREIYERAGEGMFITDPSGRFLDANPAACKLTGLDRAALLALSVGDLTDRRGLVRLKRAADREDVSGEWRIRRADGEWIYLDVSLRRLSDDRRLGVARDVSERRRMQMRLAEREARFRNLADNLPVMIWDCDATGRVLWRNRQLNAFYGVGPEAVSPPTLEMIHPDDREAGAKVFLDAVRRGTSYSLTARLRRKPGEYRWVRFEGAPKLDDAGKVSGFIGFTLDITEEHDAAARLEQERDALSSQVEAEAARAMEAVRQRQHFWDTSRDLFAIIEVETGAATMINAHAWRETLGYPPEQIIGRRLLDLAFPQDRDPALALKAEMADGQAVHGFENRFVRADGEVVWLSWSAVRDGAFTYAIARDVSEEKRARAALAESERQFRMLVAGVVDYALYMLDPEGRVANWNAGGERIKGYAAADVVGRHFSMFYTEVDRDRGVPKTALETARESGRYEAEGLRVRKDGSLFWANVVIDAIRDEAGELVGFAKITRDITERREAQLALERAHERLAHAQKMEAVGQLTGGVAHDFNNLLMVVGGRAELLRSRLGNDERVTRALDAIEHATKRGQDLTRRLLAFARRQRLQPRSVSLPGHGAALRELVHASLGPSIAVRVDLPETLWPVTVDLSELEIAILNLAVNARDAMPKGGRLDIRARNHTLEGDEELSGDFVALTVSDTGAGIPPDLLDKVCEPFFTTKEVGKGTGLGLSQVYGFAQQSGGRMIIESELGQGVQVTILLPRSQAAPAQQETPPADPAPEGLEVLVVEDNPEVAEVAKSLLEQLGHRAEMVSNAAAAIDRLQAGPAPDLVFSDIVMAGEMDGLALARRVRSAWPELPILLATGYTLNENGLEDFTLLRKPYGLADLSRALGVAIGATRLAEPAAGG